MGLDGDDIDVSFEGLTPPDNAKKHSVTVAHNPIHKLKDILKPHRDFYIFPTNDRKDSPNLHLSWKKWSRGLKQAFADLTKEDDQNVYHRWFTMETWERRTCATNHLLFAAGPLIDLKRGVDMVVCHHGTRPLIPTRAFFSKDGNIPERPYVSIHFNTSRDLTDPILYKYIQFRGLNLQGVLQAIKLPKSLYTVDTTLRFDVHRDLLWKYHQDRYLIDLGEGKNPTAITEKALSNARGFQKFMIRVFQPQQDNISLNSSKAVYFLGGGIALRTPHDKFYHFEWTLPTQRGERLLENILTHEWSKTCEMFVIKVSDLENGNLYQIQTSREQLAAHPEMDGPETWSVLHRGPRGCLPYMYTKGMSLRTKMRILANLDMSGYPCDNGRSPIQSFAWNSFHNDGLVLFHGPEAALVRFWGGGNSNENESKELPLKSIAAATWATPPTATAFEIRVPSHERTLHTQVIAGLFGPYKNWRPAADPTFAGNVYRAGYTNKN